MAAISKSSFSTTQEELAMITSEGDEATAILISHDAVMGRSPATHASLSSWVDDDVLYGILMGCVVEKDKFDAAQFSPFWNEIIANLREEDYITNLEMELLQMPKNKGNLPMVQWPLFLLASKIFLAKDIAVERRDSQDELWERITRDDYMKYAVVECYHAIKLILTEVLVGEGRMWVERVFEDIRESIENNSNDSFLNNFELSKLPLVITRLTALTGILKETETSELEKGAVKAVQDLYDVVHHDILVGDKRSES
uniref:Callose synthase helical domain-containing protein n=1 Tax=Cucumis sativus TaxID=3659 RepID=A0A0A0LZX5_CUCSA